MSLYGMMRTGISGMAGQSSRLSTVADNIANSSTNGYKRASTEFSSLIIPNSPGSYASGGVTTTVRYAIAEQGNLQYTTSVSDLAIKGDGMFVVQDANGSPFLTRAGSFIPDGEGRLINAAGFYLMGYNFENGPPSAVANGFAGLEPVVISESELVATPTTSGIFTANLPRDATVVAPADLPSAGGTEYSAKSSMVVYDNLGGEVVLDIYFTKTAANTWEVAVFDQAAAAGTSSPFPYTGGPLATETLSFDATTGRLTGASATDIDIPIPGGASANLDLASTSQLATEYTVLEPKRNGNAPSAIDQIEIAEDGTVYAQYENGSFRALYRIPLATVQSLDQLAVLPGNVFSQSTDSGDVRIGFAGESGMGTVVSGAVENSNVDIAQELTSMIESQRSYTANSKVFQTGSELLDVLVNLKR
jgi:flagellar hook protein FlgE